MPSKLIKILHSERPAREYSCPVQTVHALQDVQAAQVRLHAALREAAGADADLDSLLARADAIRGDLDDATWIDRARAWMHCPAELVHCAANLSFREADRAAVWQSNVAGTASVLQGLRRLPGIAAFN